MGKKASGKYPPAYFKAYRNQFWVREKGKVFMQQGVHGQHVYMDVENEILIVRFGSHEYNSIDPVFYEDLFDPIVEYLTTQKGGGGKKKKKGKKGKKKKKKKKKS